MALIDLANPTRFLRLVDRVLPLREARAAHDAMERREQFGKIVLVP